MPGKKIEARVLVWATREKGTIVWHLDSKKHKNSKGFLKFYSPNKEVYDVLFIIGSKDEFGLRFKPKPTDAFWVSKTGCPTEASHDDQLTPIEVKDARRKLHVQNTNSVYCVYHFALNFDSANDGSISYDPVIINQNGNFEPADLHVSVVVGAATAILVGLAAIFGLKYVRNRRGSGL